MWSASSVASAGARRPALPPRPTPPRSEALSASALQKAKLTGLLRSLEGGDALVGDLQQLDAPGAAGGIVASGGERLGAVLLEADEAPGAPELVRALGPTLIWADRHELIRLLLLAPAEVAGDLARRAAHFVDGDGETDTDTDTGGQAIAVEVHAVDGVTLVPAEPGVLPVVPDLGPDVWALAEVMRRVDARPVDDHGRLVAEIDGLEVARVTVDDGTASLEIGVGQADRELQQLVHGSSSADEVLERAAGMVRAHRRPGVPLHPLNRLARERWLRSMVLDDPSSLGLASAEPLPPLRPRSTLLGTVPSAALGHDADGRPVVVVASVGVDIDVVPEAADYRARTAPDAELLLVMPPADIHPALGRQVGRLPRARFVAVTPPWVDAAAS